MLEHAVYTWPTPGVGNMACGEMRRQGMIAYGHCRGSAACFFFSMPPCMAPPQSGGVPACLPAWAPPIWGEPRRGPSAFGAMATAEGHAMHLCRSPLFGGGQGGWVLACLQAWSPPFRRGAWHVVPWRMQKEMRCFFFSMHGPPPKWGGACTLPFMAPPFGGA